MTISKRWLLCVGLAVLALVGMSAAASAETLMMPGRDALKGTTLVVWGVTKLANSTTTYSFDFGDGNVTPFQTVSDGSYLAINHTYTASGGFTATLTATNGSTTETATATIKVFDPADPLVTADVQRSLKIDFAIEDGLRYLWQSQNNRAGGWVSDSSMTNWAGGNPVQWAALVTLAFENHGYQLSNDDTIPPGLYQKYIVRRGLNYLINNLQKVSLGIQTSGDPCVGAGIEASPCIGLFLNNQSAYSTAVAILPIAASGSLARHVISSESSGANSGGYVVNRTYGEVLQRLVNSQVWGQIDSGTGKGGWYYALNGLNGNSNFIGSSSSAVNDGSTDGWGVLAFLDAAAAGATVPAFAAADLKLAFLNSINNDGSLDYNSNGNPAVDDFRNVARTGIALQGLYFRGDTATGNAFPPASLGNASLSFLGARWQGQVLGTPNDRPNGDYWDTCRNQRAGQNKGCAYAMFNVFKGLKLQGITQLAGVSRPAGPGTIQADDWYADYQDWLVTNQTNPTTLAGGNWATMGFSCCANDFSVNAAIAELILSPVALVLPDSTKFSTIGLAPPTGSSLTGLTHTVTAHAESTGGTPVPGATVVFTVLTGPNTGKTGSSATDGSGNASFTYTDLGAGHDTIQAKIGSTLTSNTVTMDWTVTSITVNFTANNKPYDRTTDATVSACMPAGVLPADAPFVTCSLVATFDTANVGPGKTVTGSSIVLGGTRAANYALDSTAPAPTTTADITPIPATVTAGSTSKTYGVAWTFLGTEFTSSGFIAGDSVSSVTLTSAGAAAPATVAGSPYPITPSVAVGTGLGNYLIGYADGTLTVNPATLTVTANNVSKVYGTTTTITGTAFATSGLKNGDTVASASIASTGSPAAAVVNTYPITISGAVGTGLGNYTVSYVNGTLTVTAATLTVTANSPLPSPHGNPLPVLTASYAGFVNGEGPSVLGGTLLLSTLATPTSPAGSYTITPSGLTSPNYTFSYVSGTLTLTNDPPVAVNDAYSTQWNTVLTVPAAGVLANDTDVNHDVLTAIQVTAPTHGTVTLNADGSFSYKPTANFSGYDSFTYEATDGYVNSLSNIATVSITIVSPCRGDDDEDQDRDRRHHTGDGDDHDRNLNGHHDGDGCEHDRENHRHDNDGRDGDREHCKPGTPNGESDHYRTLKNTALTVIATKGVLKNDGRYAAIAELYTPPSYGTVTLAADGSFVYTPATNFVGTDIFYYVPRSRAGVAGAVTSVTIRVSSEGDGDGDDRDRKRDGDRPDRDR